MIRSVPTDLDNIETLDFFGLPEQVYAEELDELVREPATGRTLQ